MYETLILSLLHHLYPGVNLEIFRSSLDPELARLFDCNAVGSAGLNEDGSVHIMLDDREKVSKLTWLEEGAHVLQCLKKGHVALSRKDLNEWEVEAMTCLLGHADKLRLTTDERADCERRREHYRNA